MLGIWVGGYAAGSCRSARYFERGHFIGVSWCFSFRPCQISNPNQEPWFKMIRPLQMNHFQPFWFPKVSIFKPKIFAKLRISLKILHQLTRATPTLPSMENQEASSRTEFVSRSLSEPKIFPKSSQRSFPGGWRMLVVDRWLHFPKSHQENHQLFGSQWTVEPYWNSYGFQLVIFTLFWQIDIWKK